MVVILSSDVSRRVFSGSAVEAVTLGVGHGAIAAGGRLHALFTHRPQFITIMLLSTVLATNEESYDLPAIIFYLALLFFRISS